MIQFLTGLLARLAALFRALPKSSAASGGAAVLIATAVFVGPWKGERTERYLYRIASPAVWTVCEGETKGVKAGGSYTPQQGLDMLQSSVAGYQAQLSKCIPALPEKPQGCRSR